MAELQGYPVPVFFSEDGCNVVRPRTFSDMPSIFGPNMTPILSGAIIYEWTQEANDYGIIQYPDTTIQNSVSVPIGSPVPLDPEFDTLMSVWAAVSPSSIAESAYTPQKTTFACPATVSGWTIDPNASLPPTPTNLTAPSGSVFSFSSVSAVDRSSILRTSVVINPTTIVPPPANPSVDNAGGSQQTGGNLGAGSSVVGGSSVTGNPKSGGEDKRVGWLGLVIALTAVFACVV